MERRMAKIQGPKGLDFLEISGNPKEREITTGAGSKRVKPHNDVSVKETSLSHQKVQKEKSFHKKAVSLRQKAHQLFSQKNKLTKAQQALDQVQTDIMCKNALKRIDNRDMLGALQTFRDASIMGSREAKFWLGDIERLAPLPSPEKPSKSKTLNIDSIDIRQNAILHKFTSLLYQLHEINPNAYAKRTVDRIANDLQKGHCNGLAIYHMQLSILKHPGKTRYRSNEYYDFMQKMMSWDQELFEPPHGFNYHKYRAGDIQGLSPDEQERLAFTDDFKEVLQLIRFEQQAFHEASSQIFKGQNTPGNMELILGPRIQTSETYQLMTKNGDITPFLPTLKAYLSNKNAAFFSIPAADGENHAISICYRGGKYYYFDSNHTSLETDYSPQHSAVSYDTLEDLTQQISTFFQIFEMNVKPFQFRNIGPTKLTFFDLKKRETQYPTAESETNRLQIINLNKLATLLEPDLFESLFSPMTHRIDSQTVQLLFDADPTFITLLPPNSLKHIRTINVKNLVLDSKTYYFLMKAAPKATLVGQKIRKSLAEAHHNLVAETTGRIQDYHFRRSLAEGDELALEETGMWFFQNQSYLEALDYFKKASPENSKIQFYIGQIYMMKANEEDKGSSDYEFYWGQAIKHYKISADQGFIWAQKKLKMLKK